MESLIFHLVVIPGIFLLGRLSRSVTIVGFRAKPAKTQSKFRNSEEGKRALPSYAEESFFLAKK